MRIALIAEYVRTLPWSPTRWTVEIARGLAAQGHAVEVLLDGCDDPSEFKHPDIGASGTISVVVRRPLRIARQRAPLSFQRWATTRLAALSHDTSLSLTRLVPGSVWVPIGPPSAAEFVSMIRARSPASIGFEIAQNPWVLASMLAERRAPGLARSSGMRPILARLGADDDGSCELLGTGSSMPVATVEQRRTLRAAVRQVLEIPDHTLVIAASVMHPGRPGLGAMLDGLARASRRSQIPDADPGLVLIAACRSTHSLARLATRSGAEALVRTIGTSSSVRAMLAASDLATSAQTSHPGHATGRFLADALRMGVPVLAHRRAPGASLILPTAFGTPALGIVVDDHNPEHWADAIAHASDPVWRREASRAARDAGRALSTEAVVQRVERALLRARNTPRATID